MYTHVPIRIFPWAGNESIGGIRLNTVTYLPCTVEWPGGLRTDTYSNLVWSLPTGLAVMLYFIHESKHFHGWFFNFITFFSFLHRSLFPPFIKVKPVLIYLLTATGLSPGGRSTVHIYTQTIHRTTQNKQYIEQHKYFGRVRALSRLCELYPGICLTTEEKTRKNLSQGSRRVPANTMKIHNLTIRLYRHNNKNT
jgi:hypothetical protein